MISPAVTLSDFAIENILKNCFLLAVKICSGTEKLKSSKRLVCDSFCLHSAIKPPHTVVKWLWNFNGREIHTQTFVISNQKKKTPELAAAHKDVKVLLHLLKMKFSTMSKLEFI